MPALKKPQRKMTDEHKAAIASGRDENRKVTAYLELIGSTKTKRGRRPGPDAIAARLAAIADELPTAGALSRLELVQERINLQADLAALQAAPDLSAVEADFVSVAKSYSDRKGTSYVAWREVGVPAAVLKRAGITRSS